jgi:hypothetical protein
MEKRPETPHYISVKQSCGEKSAAVKDFANNTRLSKWYPELEVVPRMMVNYLAEFSPRVLNSSEIQSFLEGVQEEYNPALNPQMAESLFDSEKIDQRVETLSRKWAYSRYKREDIRAVVIKSWFGCQVTNPIESINHDYIDRVFEKAAENMNKEKSLYVIYHIMDTSKYFLTKRNNSGLPIMTVEHEEELAAMDPRLASVLSRLCLLTPHRKKNINDREQLVYQSGVTDNQLNVLFMFATAQDSELSISDLDNFFSRLGFQENLSDRNELVVQRLRTMRDRLKEKGIVVKFSYKNDRIRMSSLEYSPNKKGKNNY